MFGYAQDTALSDYIQAVLMLKYNTSAKGGLTMPLSTVGSAVTGVAGVHRAGAGQARLIAGLKGECLLCERSEQVREQVIIRF